EAESDHMEYAEEQRRDEDGIGRAGARAQRAEEVAAEEQLLHDPGRSVQQHHGGKRKLLERDDNGDQLLEARQVGTGPAYLEPEQLQNKRPQRDAKEDPRGVGQQ